MRDKYDTCKSSRGAEWGQGSEGECARMAAMTRAVASEMMKSYRIVVKCAIAGNADDEGEERAATFGGRETY